MLMPSPSFGVVSHKPLHVAIAHRRVGIVSLGNVVTQHGPVIVANQWHRGVRLCPAAAGGEGVGGIGGGVGDKSAAAQ